LLKLLAAITLTGAGREGPYGRSIGRRQRTFEPGIGLTLTPHGKEADFGRDGLKKVISSIA
jgi:hypothetical protein